MQTYQEQREFFSAQRAALRAALDTGGAAAAVQFINGFGDELQRRVLYHFAKNELIENPEQARDFNAYIAVVNAGIAELLRQAVAAADEETRGRRTWGAQVLSYNLAADLAECWPGDVTPRSQAQRERGLKAAQDCLSWCTQLGKGPAELSTALWVQGMHQLGLGDRAGAVASWQQSRDYAVQAQQAAGKPTAVGADADWSVLLTSGYLALGRLATGDAAGAELYRQATEALREQLVDAEKKDDAQYCLDQLEEVKHRFIDAQQAAG